MIDTDCMISADCMISTGGDGLGLPLAAVLRSARDRLAAAGVPSPGPDAEQLAARVLGLARGELTAAALRGRRIDPEQAHAVDELVEHRASRVPLQHLTGRAPFRTVELAVGPGVFVPRPETEVVAGLAVAEAAALARAGASPVVVDLCTGSGAIAIAVAVEVPATRVVAVELDPLALAWARRNVDGLAPDVDLRQGSVVGCDARVLADLAGVVDVVVANPPYIPDGARPVDPEVADHDPWVALYGGGADGLDVPRGVVAAAARLLRDGGLLVMEHGEAQGAAARRLVDGRGWHDVVTTEDLTGRARALLARRG
jgi:release factor glutamine methyltransferase